MARMIPSTLAENTESEAERLLYRKFEEEVSDDYTVIHQARWVGRRGGLRGRDGEADFVVLHPTRGILVLEAKGGEITLDGRRGCWVERRGREERVLRQSPARQALDSKHALLNRFLATKRLQDRLLHLVHAVALPHVAVPDEGLGMELPRARILDARDLQHLETWIGTALASADLPPVSKPPLGTDGVERVVDAIAVTRKLRVFTPALADRVRARFLALTEEQYDVLGMLASGRRLLITGGPGTGKTMLAVEATRRFAAQGLEVLLLCFNAPLGGHLARVTEGMDGVTALHFHAFCRQRAREAGLEGRLAAAETPEGWEHVFPELLLEASERLERPFDAIVVDEAQDFRETWWAALEGCLVNGSEGRLTLFEDERQALDEHHGSVRPGDLFGPVPLTRNCRNPDEIHAFLAAVPGGPRDLRPSGVGTGFRPRITWARTPGRLPRLVSGVVARLISEWSVPPGEIAVLTPRAAHRSALGKIERLGPAPCAWRERPDVQHVLIDTIHRFKGLEATAVVLAEVTPESRPDPATCLRVGCSRPLVHLDLVAPPELGEWLGAALEHAEVEGR